LLFDRLTDQSWYGCEDHSCRACLPVNEIREVDGKDWSCSDSSIIGIDGYCALSLPTQKEIYAIFDPTSDAIQHQYYGAKRFSFVTSAIVTSSYHFLGNSPSKFIPSCCSCKNIIVFIIIRTYLAVFQLPLSWFFQKDLYIFLHKVAS